MSCRSPSRVGRNGRPHLRPVEELVRVPRRSPLAPQLELALAAASRLHLLCSDLQPVPVQPTSTRSEAGTYRYREADPVDLRVSRCGGRVVVGFLHELGHFVDHQLCYDARTREWASDAHPELEAWRDAISALTQASLDNSRVRRYFASPRELWARSYAQTVLLRSCDPMLTAILEELQRAGDVYVWPSGPFEPVAVEVERVFDRLGLTRLAHAVAA